MNVAESNPPNVRGPPPGQGSQYVRPFPRRQAAAETGPPGRAWRSVTLANRSLRPRIGTNRPRPKTYRIVVQEPGEGYRHVLTPDQIRARLAQVPQQFPEGPRGHPAQQDDPQKAVVPLLRHAVGQHAVPVPDRRIVRGALRHASAAESGERNPDVRRPVGREPGNPAPGR